MNQDEKRVEIYYSVVYGLKEDEHGKLIGGVHIPESPFFATIEQARAFLKTVDEKKYPSQGIGEITAIWGRG